MHTHTYTQTHSHTHIRQDNFSFLYCAHEFCFYLFRNITSLKEELIPQLVKAQFQTAHMIPKPNPYAQFMDSSCVTTPATRSESSHPLVTMTNLASSCHDDLEQLALSMSSGGHTGMENHLISCHAHIASSDLLCIRVNTAESYKEVNKRVRLVPYPHCTSITIRVFLSADATLCLEFVPE